MGLIIGTIEDNQDTLDHLFGVLKSNAHIKKFYTARNWSEASQMIKSYPIDIFLLDLGLPDIDGQALIPVIKEHQPEAKIIVLTVLSSARHIMEVIQLGANGYLLKHEVNSGLIDKILQAISGNAPVSAEVSKVLIKKLQASMPKPLNASDMGEKLAQFRITEKEAQILSYLTQGLSISIIAARVNKSTHTVNLYLRSIYSKLNVHSRGAAVHVAISEGLVFIAAQGNPPADSSTKYNTG